MLKDRRQSFLKKYKTFLMLNFSMLVFLLGVGFYFHTQNLSRQKNLEKTLSQQSDDLTCVEASIRLSDKMDMAARNFSKNEVAFEIFVIYSAAYDLSRKKNTKCLLLEQWGDDVYNAYRQGVKDGKKASLGAL
jgi:hypothetical protein